MWVTLNGLPKRQNITEIPPRDRSPFLELPVELRVMIYRCLPRDTKHVFFDRFMHDPNGTLPFWELRDRVCKVDILRVNKKIYSEAKPTIDDELRRRKQKDGHAYHISSLGSSVVNIMAQINRIRFGENSEKLWKLYRDFGDSWVSGFKFRLSPRNLDPETQAKIRMRQFDLGHSVHIDYNPLPNRDRYQEISFEQDLALLTYLRDYSDGEVTIFIHQGGESLSLQSFLKILQRDGSNQSWQVWFGNILRDRWWSDNLIRNTEFQCYPATWACENFIQQPPHPSSHPTSSAKICHVLTYLGLLFIFVEALVVCYMYIQGFRKSTIPLPKALYGVGGTLLILYWCDYFNKLLDSLLHTCT